MAGDSTPEVRDVDALTQVVFHLGDPDDPVAHFQETVDVPVPDRGDTLSLRRGAGYVDEDADRLQFDVDDEGTYLVKDRTYDYNYLSYPTEDGQGEARRLICSVYVELEPR